jgi:hypothetical protein
VTASEFRRLAARVNLLRAHVELAMSYERNSEHRRALDRLRELLVEGERGMASEADAMNRMSVGAV